MKKSKIAFSIAIVMLATSTMYGCNLSNKVKDNISNSIDQTEVSEEYEVRTYTLNDPNKLPLELDVVTVKVLAPKDDLSELVKKTYEEQRKASNGYLKDGSAVTNVEQKDGVTYITLNSKFSENWPGGTFYEGIVFHTMTASFCSIDGVDKIKYKLEGEQPSLHIDLEGIEYTDEYLTENYKLNIK